MQGIKRYKKVVSVREATVRRAQEYGSKGRTFSPPLSLCTTGFESLSPSVLRLHNLLIAISFLFNKNLYLPLAVFIAQVLVGLSIKLHKEVV